HREPSGRPVHGHLRRLARGRRFLQRPRPPARGPHHLLPEEPAHLRRPEGRGAGRRGQARRHRPQRQAPWPQPGHLVDAPAAAPLRAKIVATREGGMITGEERLREYLGGLYGDVNGYDGRPTASQAARAEALARELEDVIREFNQLTAQRLPAVNRGLAAKHLEPVRVVSEADWQTRNAGEGAPP